MHLRKSKKMELLKAPFFFPLSGKLTNQLNGVRLFTYYFLTEVLSKKVVSCQKWT
jgi:hypothetical protein